MEHQKKILSLVSTCSFIIGDFYDLCKPIFDYKEKFDCPELVWILGQLCISCHLTSESVLILIGNLKLWDAEILIRSIFEGTIKYLFLSIGNMEERKNKFNEFIKILPDISHLKRHKRITTLLEFANSFPEEEADNFRKLLLSENDFNEYTKKYPKTLIKKIEQKWSFNEMIKEISTAYSDYKSLLGFGYIYGMNSHFIHKDGDSINLYLDRFFRNEERQLSIELAHSVREFSDLISMAALRTKVLLSLYNHNSDSIKLIFEKYKDFFGETNIIQKEWRNIEAKY